MKSVDSTVVRRRSQPVAEKNDLRRCLLTEKKSNLGSVCCSETGR